MNIEQAIQVANGITQDAAELTEEQAEATRIVVAQRVANSRHLQYLSETDWYVTRQQEAGVLVPSDVREQRQLARSSIVDC